MPQPELLSGLHQRSWGPISFLHSDSSGSTILLAGLHNPCSTGTDRRPFIRTTRADLIGFIVVLIGFVNGEPGEIVSHFKDILITLVPRRRSLENHHDTLLGEAELYKTGLADIGAQPAGVLDVVVARKLRCAKTLDHSIEFLALEAPRV